MKRTLLAAGGLGLAFIVFAVAWAWLAMRASLPRLDGEMTLLGLRAPVTVERDSLGVPTLRASNREDLALATGFVHAQDRFFQMDLMRKRAAGELASLFGPAALAVDRANRVHRFRHVAQQVLEWATEEERRLVRAYSHGVNQGLNALDAKPFEYVLLRAVPDAWTEVDTVLTAFAMYLSLDDHTASRESSRSALHAVLPQPIYELLEPLGTEWDAPLLGEPIAPPPVPGPEVYDLRALQDVDFEAIAAQARGSLRNTSEIPGSNNWAVAGTRTSNGKAILANDMHLPLGVPNTFYRARLIISATGQVNPRLDITGVMIPGSFTIVAGSNRNVAWGFTNSYGDWMDLVVLEISPDDPHRYLTPEGLVAFEEHTELLYVNGGEPEAFTFRSSVWGPVVDRDHMNRPRALSWLAHYPEAVNFGLYRLERARDVYEAIVLGTRTGIPPQNFVVADRDGRIAWTLMGRAPVRAGFDASVASTWSKHGTGWRGWLQPELYPRVIDPESGLIWTANSRVVDAKQLPVIGSHGYPLAARAHQIQGQLNLLDEATLRDMLAVQLDDRALMLQDWQALLLDVLSPDTLSDFPSRREFRRLVEDWGARASVSSAGYRLVRGFRDAVLESVFAALTAEVRTRYPKATLIPSHQFEGSLKRLVRDRPMHLLDPRFESWEGLMLAAIDRLIEELAGQSPDALARRTWGQRNTVRIAHPMSRAVPLMSGWLDMPAEPLPGDADMPRVQAVSFGASVRFAVSPGAEESGYLHMPAGQSGHPLSPFYRAGHRAWADGEAMSFLPGEPAFRLVLRPH